MQYTNAQQAPWILDIELSNPQFGITNVRVDVKGPFGYNVYQMINWQQTVNLQGASTGTIHVKFNIPSNVIPNGNKYQVCASNQSDLLNMALPSCMFVIHSHDNYEHITLPLQR
jgi:hypothetical protein